MNSNTYISTEKLKVYAAGKLYGQEKLAVEAYLQENPEEQETVEAFRNYLNQGGSLHKWNWKMQVQKKTLFFRIAYSKIQKSIKDTWKVREAWVGGLFASFTPKRIIYAFGIVAVVVFIGINFPKQDTKPVVTDSLSPREQPVIGDIDSVMQNNQRLPQPEEKKGGTVAIVDNTKQDSTEKIVSTTNTNPPSANDTATKQVTSVIPIRIEPTVTDTVTIVNVDNPSVEATKEDPNNLQKKKPSKKEHQVHAGSTTKKKKINPY